MHAKKRKSPRPISHGMKIAVLKLGGSVLTYKDAKSPRVRRALLRSVFHEIAVAQKQLSDTSLIIIHGAGSFAHRLAKTHKLREGTYSNKKRVQGALATRLAMQKLNTEVLTLALESGISAVSVHPGTLFIGKDGAIGKTNLAVLKEALNAGLVPLLYGETIFDSERELVVCSGDEIAAYLGKLLPVTDMYFASDVDGICTDDPYKDPGATLVEHITLREGINDVRIGHSHNVDVTGGLKGKVEVCKKLFANGIALRTIHIFNGFSPKHYGKVLRGHAFPHTTIVR